MLVDRVGFEFETSAVELQNAGARVPGESALELLDQYFRLVVFRCRHFHVDVQTQHPIDQVVATREHTQLVDGRDGALFPRPARDALGAYRRHTLPVDEDDRDATWIFLVESRCLWRARIDRRRMLAARRDVAEAVRVANGQV